MSARPITIAITALGGQGGGVLANWIRDLGEANGYIAQSTSVPGVAQRTGTTVYYLELFPESACNGRTPVLALSPVAGDVDIVVAAELMEAGRAVQRGFVTPDRTVLVASSHRAYAVSEKTAPGNGIADAGTVLDAARASSKSFLHFDMQALAEQCGAVISAALFGALGGAGALPFDRAAFERVIRARGIAEETNLRAFAEAWQRAEAGGDVVGLKPDPQLAVQPAESPLGVRIRQRLPQPVWSTAWEGCRQLVDYQDARYAEQYLERLESIAALDDAAHGYRLSTEVARHLTLWMAYQDVIRVASQKIRATRIADIRREVRAADNELVEPIEYMHPRLEEACDVMPRALGAHILASAGWRERLERFFHGGRLVRTGRLRGFLLLSLLAVLRPWRRGTLRYSFESQHIEAWLARIAASAPHCYELAVELARCQRLLKGYGDTQARGWTRFARIMAFVADATLAPRTAEAVARLHAAALADENGNALDAVFAELRSSSPLPQAGEGQGRG